VKLFQIEEPEGGPADPDAPGAAIGVDVSRPYAVVAFAVGGNAVVLADREGFERPLPVPSIGAEPSEWQAVLEGARIRAERALGRPVTHAVITLGAGLEVAADGGIRAAAERAGLQILQFVPAGDLPAAVDPVLAAAVLAEDLAPRPDFRPATDFR
jgi:hypothetical protein